MELARRKDIGLTTDFDPKLSFVALNEKEFDHVASNLISNALKFTKAGGHINIATTQRGNEVCIAISDTGIGIAPDLLEAVFDKFNKAGRKGLDGEKSTGLGLWIVKRIVLLHGGKITVSSQVGEGTTFRILLPL